MGVEDEKDKEDEDDAEFCRRLSPLAFHVFPDGPPPPPPPLAFHVFPDGPPPPPPSRSGGARNGGGTSGGWAWPKRPSSRSAAPRAVVSSREAQESLPALLARCRQGLTAPQAAAVLRLACELPRANNSGTYATLRSPLAKDEANFRSLIRSVTLRDGHFVRDDDALLVASSLTQGVSVPSRRCVLQFLYLLAQVQELPSHLHPILVDQLHGDAGADDDAARLLLRITKREHVTVAAAQRLRLRVRRLQAATTTTTTKKKFASAPHRRATSLQALSALLRLYARLDPNCHDWAGPVRYDAAARPPDSHTDDWHQFPDAEWEQAFLSSREPTPATTSLVGPASKRRWVGRLRHLDAALELPTGCRGSLESCLRNPGLGQRVGLSSLPHGRGDEEIVRLRTLLPFVLKERLHSLAHEPYHHVVQHLLGGMRSFVQRDNVLLPEFQDFIESCLLTNWDGQVGGLLLDVLTGWGPCSFDDLRCRLLHHLERFFMVGEPSLQYRIVGALTTLVHRWGRLDWRLCASTSAGSCSTQASPLAKVDTLRSIVLWLDTMLVKAMIMNYGDDDDEPKNKELLHLAAIRFFATARELSQEGDCGVLGAPSVPLVHRLLLARSAFVVDRLCHLLASYHPIFLRLEAAAVSAPQEAVPNDRGSVALYKDCIGEVCWALYREGQPPTHSEDVKGAIRMTPSRLYDNLRPSTQLELHRLQLEDSTGIFDGLSLMHGAVFLGFYRQFLQEHGPVTHSLNALDYRIQGTTRRSYLDYLNKLGFTGVYNFMCTFVGVMARRPPTRIIEASHPCNGR